MPTSYSDQFYLIDPYSPPAAGTAMNFTHYTLTDQDDDADFEAAGGDTINGIDITDSWPGDTVTINVPGIGNITYTGVTFYLADGSRVFTPNDGQVLQNGTLVSTTWVSSQGPLYAKELGPTCFTPGTLIKTVAGLSPIEDLRPGTLVHTRDNGLQPLRWIGRNRHKAAGVFAPVLIKEGALGNRADLLVSQQHRILVTGWQAQIYLGADEVLVAARDLVNGGSIRIIEGGEVEYLHLLFDRHEILNTSGLHSESYHPAYAATTSDRTTRAELLRLFPEFTQASGQQAPAARRVARAFEGRLLAA